LSLDNTDYQNLLIIRMLDMGISCNGESTLRRIWRNGKRTLEMLWTLQRLW